MIWQENNGEKDLKIWGVPHNYLMPIFAHQDSNCDM
jgi:hypothetical protein